MGKTVAEQLISYLDKNQLLCHLQFGFRKGYSKELANSYLINNIKRSLDDGKIVGEVLDLKKSFDTVNHDILLHKLMKYNFSQTALNRFIAYLKIENSVSKLMKK